jgi:hypothetical protein
VRARGDRASPTPATLKLRYAVALDPADIAKAMWAEVAPAAGSCGRRAGSDLLAYDTAAPGARTRCAVRPVGSPSGRRSRHSA